MIVQRAPTVGAKIWCLFFFLFLFVGHALSTEHCAVERCIVRTSVAVYRPISTRFAAFFQKGLFFQTHYLVRILIARWRHNFRWSDKT